MQHILNEKAMVEFVQPNIRKWINKIKAKAHILNYIIKNNEI